MILSLIAILLVGLIAFIWSSRGFFNALIHMACTIAAGAVAFGLWEPISYAILNAAPARGLFSAIEGMAFGLGLAIPFAVSLLLLRVVADVLIRANVMVSSPVNYAGGAICGLVSGVITAGVIVLSLGFFRFNAEFMGFKPVQYDGNGNLVDRQSLILPVDRLTARLYGSLSEGVLASNQSLAQWHPRLETLGPTMRITNGGGKARNSLKPEHMSVMGRFTVGGPGVQLQSLLSDALDPSPQRVADMGGNTPDATSRIEGFIVRVSNAASEKNGKVVIGPGAVRLVVSSADGTDRRVLHPIAVSSQAQAASPTFGRWRFDAADVFIASVGGAAESLYGFEFIVPPGLEPRAIYVRGVRTVIDQSVPALATFTSASARDRAITRLPLLAQGQGAGGVIDLDISTVVTAPIDQQSRSVRGISFGPSLGMNVQKGLERPLEIDDRNVILGGEKTWAISEFNGMQGGMERSLRIDRFAENEDTYFVQVDVSMDSAFTLLNPQIQQMERDKVAVQLIDNNGQSYVPIGFILQDEQIARIRFTPQQPIKTLKDLDESAKRLSRSSPGDKLRLVFRISRGVEVRYFAVGSKALLEFRPPLRGN